MRFVALLLLLSMCVFTDEISAGLKVLQSNEKQLTLLWNIDKSYPDSLMQKANKISELAFTEQNSVVMKNGVAFPSYSFLVGIPDNKHPPN